MRDEPTLEEELADLGLDRDGLEAWEAMEPPDGFADRVLEARVRAEEGGAGGEVAVDGSARGAVVSLQEPRTRAQAAARAVFWAAVGAAAVLAVVFWVAPWGAGPEAPGVEVSEVAKAPVLGPVGAAGALARPEVTSLGDDGAVFGPAVEALRQDDGSWRVQQRMGDAFYAFSRPVEAVVTTPSGEARVRGQTFRVKVVELHEMCDGPNEPPDFARTELVVYEGQGTLVGQGRRLEVRPCKPALVSSEPVTEQVQGVPVDELLAPSLEPGLNPEMSLE